MKWLTTFLKNPWTIGIGAPLIVFVLTDIVFKQYLLSTTWNWLIQLNSSYITFPIWILFIVLIGIGLFIFLFIKIRNNYFKNDKYSIIGNYTFRELYHILRTEYINESHSPLVSRDFKQFSLLDIFITCHSRLSSGVNIEDDLFLYHNVCPRLYLFDLMNKEDEKFKDPDIIIHHYTINENGKRFWAIVNKLSIKNRIQTEKNY